MTDPIRLTVNLNDPPFLPRIVWSKALGCTVLEMPYRPAPGPAKTFRVKMHIDGGAVKAQTTKAETK